MKLLLHREENSVKNRLLTLNARALLMLGCGFSCAETVENGFEAYKRGDFSNAVPMFRLVSEQGNSTVQYNLGLM